METTLALTRPQIAIQSVTELMQIVREMREKLFVEGTDYGTIPGTNNKPTLLLPGMEKLMRALRLVPKYVELSKVEDFDKPLIFYRYECQLIEADTGVVIATAIGSANSHESKWRWREQKRKCPTCGKETINHSRDEGKGWYCWKKIGGCGATFTENAPDIVNQVVGRIENPDIFDQMNTIDKIAQKRALGSAIKGAANVSEFFTVDLEDLPPSDYTPPPSGQIVTVEPPPQQPVAAPPAPPASAAPAQVIVVTDPPQTAENAPNAANPLFDAIPSAITPQAKKSTTDKINVIWKPGDTRSFDVTSVLVKERPGRTGSMLECETLQNVLVESWTREPFRERGFDVNQWTLLGFKLEFPKALRVLAKFEGKNDGALQVGRWVIKEVLLEQPTDVAEDIPA